MPPRNNATTGTIGEVAPADERVALVDTSGAALSTAAVLAGGAPTSDTPVIDAASRAIVGGTVQAGSLAAAAAALDAPAEVLREVPGPGVGAERVAERVDTVRDRPVGDVEHPQALLPAAPLIDPDAVPGRRRVQVATRVTHDGHDHTPDHKDPARRSVLLDFKQYSELAAIGAVIPLSSRDVRDWADDED